MYLIKNLTPTLTLPLIEGGDFARTYWEVTFAGLFSDNRPDGLILEG